jgi:hypothetical protein
LPLFGHLMATWLVFMSLPSYEKWIGYDFAIETVFKCLIESVGWCFCFYAQELVAKSISIHYGKFGEVNRPIMHQIVWMNILMTRQTGVFVLKWFTLGSTNLTLSCGRPAICPLHMGFTRIETLAMEQSI